MVYAEVCDCGSNFTNRTTIYCIKPKIGFYIIYNNAAHPIIHKCRRLCHMCKTLTWTQHITKMGGFSPINEFDPASFYWGSCTMHGDCTIVYMRVWGID
jgi:hypothetical protein